MQDAASSLPSGRALNEQVPQIAGSARSGAAPSGEGSVSVPPNIAAIIERLHTQDNRITSHPLFAVQQKRVIGGLDEEYADRHAWICDGTEVDSEEAARLDAVRRAGDAIPAEYRRLGFIEKWEFVTSCLTEQGCKDFIACNGHNLNEPRIYAYSGYRNAEFIALREWLMTLAQSSQARDQLSVSAGTARTDGPRPDGQGEGA